MVITKEQALEYRLMALDLAQSTGLCADPASLIESAKTIFKYITKGE
jgi:hypothetical protein